MRFTIEGASPEFERKLLALLADHRRELTFSVGTEWDVERAEQYLASLPGNALTFAKLVVDADGNKDADELRDQFGGDLRGPTIALSRALPRGVRRKWWPAGTEAPITPRYDPEIPSWQKAIAYTMTSANLPVFREAFDRLTHGRQAARAAGLHPGGAGKTTMSWTPDPSLLEGSPNVKFVDLDGSSLPPDDDQDDDGVMQCHVCLQPYEADEQGNASHLDTAHDADHTPRS